VRERYRAGIGNMPSVSAIQVFQADVLKQKQKSKSVEIAGGTGPLKGRFTVEGISVFVLLSYGNFSSKLTDILTLLLKGQFHHFISGSKRERNII
jgi:hypothetical protein